MCISIRPLRPVLLVYAALSLGLWFVPLLNRLHVESSAVVAGAAFFVAGWSSLVWLGRGAAVRQVIGRQEAALLVPWLLLTITVLWAPNCGYLQGFLLFLLFAPVSVALAVALAFVLHAGGFRRRRLGFVLIGLALAVLGPLYDLGFHPQFYTYNHVFGGVVGPVYDEELTIRTGLVAFRGLTLLWAALLYLVGRRLRMRNAGSREEREIKGRAVERPASRLLHPKPSFLRFIDSPLLPLILVLCIGLIYLFAAPLGINTPAWYLQRELGGLHRTEHFDMYYDPQALDEATLRVVAADHEYRFAQLAAQLDVEVPERIASYLYPDPETKARLTGARYTNVAPVWLPRPQAHVLLDAYAEVFPHELAHVFSREFGLPVVNASLAVGLVEGFAVAVEPPDGRPTPHEQVAAALTLRTARSDAVPDVTGNLAARLSPLGFWTGRGAVSYTAMGSFVRYLIDTYGPERIKEVYARANFEEVYGRPVETLAREWQTYILKVPVMARSTGTFVVRRFNVLSLFEQRCPHYVPPYRRAYQRGLDVLVKLDSARAMLAFEESLARQPHYEPALVAWARLQLAVGQWEETIDRLEGAEPVARSPVLAVTLGDAYAALGRTSQARAQYENALLRLPAYAHEQRILVRLRLALAGQPDAVQALVSGGPPDQRARRLVQIADDRGAGGALQAINLAAAGRYAEAARRLERAGGAAMFDEARPANEWEQQRQAWLAAWWFRAGEYGRAEAAARAAAGRAGEAGDMNSAAHLLDLAEEIAWVAARG